MSMTDPIADLLTRVRNAIASRHETVDIPSSKMKLELIRILKEEGYISNYTVSSEQKQGMIRVYLRYAPGRVPVISTLTRVSRPGCRVYADKSRIPTVQGGMGVCVISTSRGLLTGKQAQEKGLGGEVLCTIS
ncbi:MAG: 30S ribosomal protein S8 [Acidobacteriia bacterium]|nr:30S ribosomal protein S8 [Terriglobia bacterium]